MTRQRIFISPARFGGAYVIFDVRSAISHNKSDFCYFHSCPFKLSESMSCNPRNPNYYIISSSIGVKLRLFIFGYFCAEMCIRPINCTVSMWSTTSAPCSRPQVIRFLQINAFQNRSADVSFYIIIVRRWHSH